MIFPAQSIEIIAFFIVPFVDQKKTSFDAQWISFTTDF